MKKRIFLIAVCAVVTMVVSAQKWSDLTNEQKVTKAKAFIADNQKYMKSIGLSQEQVDDVSNVNICYLSTLDRINRYGKDDAAKEKYAKAATDARNAQLDAIMGPDKHKQYSDYVTGKIKDAMAKQ